MNEKLNSLTKEQFELAMANYAIAHGYLWETWDIHSEWDRYKQGRSWAHEYFTNEGAKYVA